MSHKMDSNQVYRVHVTVAGLVLEVLPRVGQHDEDSRRPVGGKVGGVEVCYDLRIDLFFKLLLEYIFF